MPNADSGHRDIHRIGGSSVENLRLKPMEAALNPPGISAIKTPTPGDAAREFRAALPKAKKMHEMARIMGSGTEESIRRAGFDVMPDPSVALPNHHRIIHPDGVVGFSDANLSRLAEAFVDTMGN